PQLELECLAALWALERAPVAEVHARLASRGRPLAYTTILTVLDRLRRKRVVKREQMRERALARLVSNYFDSRGEFERYLGVDAASAPLPRAVPVVAEPEPALLD